MFEDGAYTARPEELGTRRTSADVVFDHLYREIVSLDLLPGAKMSEVEIARRFGVSRQPVRDAFSRLGNLGYLTVRPQKATEVRRFSTRAIAAARFVRLALELEVVRRCHARWSRAQAARFDATMRAQADAVARDDRAAFLIHDLEFHLLLCELGDAAHAAAAITENKAQVDRLRRLSHEGKAEMSELLDDHRALLGALGEERPDAAVQAMRHHLGRLDRTVEQARARYDAYFED
ncbi:GntR family transcriptional regulator [uncultured Jannaschia sp.]|uniref:GntR family transcriptional regulator n=1 Tax=uncultured Jannaschia sp. TaxID=293347 RepID=UPI00261F0714|nr:GntR family transcriptional regulator [uncultured Jannaschia sp.]